MKKSEMYYQAQLAVLRDSFLNSEQKLEIITALIADRSLELWNEERAEKAAAEAAEAKEAE